MEATVINKMANYNSDSRLNSVNIQHNNWPYDYWDPNEPSA